MLIPKRTKQNYCMWFQLRWMSSDVFFCDNLQTFGRAFFIVNSYLEALLPSSAILTNCIDIVQIHVVIITMFIQSFGRLFQCFICVVFVAVVKEVLLKVLYMINQCI